LFLTEQIKDIIIITNGKLSRYNSRGHGPFVLNVLPGKLSRPEQGRAQTGRATYSHFNLKTRYERCTKLIVRVVEN